MTAIDTALIPADVQATIQQSLTRIEHDHGVQILHACESGSRAWGFASQNSDFDVRFLYWHPADWYLSVEEGRDVIELPISGDLDINGWDLRKALRLLKKANPVLIEWLHSPLVYRQAPAQFAGLFTLAERFHSPLRSYHHYLSMAKTNYREYLQGETVRWKKYLYVLRPLLACEWLLESRGVVPMRFAELVDALVTDPALRTAIDELLAKKQAGLETAEGPRQPVLNAAIEAGLAQLTAVAPPANEPTDWSPLDDYFRQTVRT